MTQPLVVCWGMGQDSTGMLVGMWERGIRPKLIITTDVGGERPETYAFRPVFDDWLESVGFPRSVTVQPSDYKHRVAKIAAQDGLRQIRVGQVRPDDLGRSQVGPCQISVTEISSGQVGIAQTSATQIRTAQVGVAQRGRVQVGTKQLSFCHVATPQVYPAQANMAQVEVTAQVRVNIAQGLHPLVPHCDTLSQDFQVFGVCQKVTRLSLSSSKSAQAPG